MEKGRKRMFDKIEKWLKKTLSEKYYVRNFIKGFSFAMVVGLIITSLILCLMTLSPWYLMLNIASPVLVGIINMVD